MGLSLMNLMDARVSPGAVQSRLHARFDRVRVAAVKPDWQFQYAMICSDTEQKDRLILLFGWNQGWRYEPWSPWAKYRKFQFRLEEV